MYKFSAKSEIGEEQSPKRMFEENSQKGKQRKKVNGIKESKTKERNE